MASKKEIEEFIRNIPLCADNHVRLCKAFFGVELDYSISSIPLLDEIITKAWKQPPLALEQVVISFGSYLGETIRRSHGGQWGHDQEKGFHLVGVEGTNITLFPFYKVRKRLVNGEKDSLSFYYVCLRGLIKAAKTQGKTDT